ncbi:MAG: hypothetical protein AB7U73_21955, partial [Pirellulales bacterium]
HLVGYAGRIVWDTSKPVGQAVKVFDVARARALGLNCATPLDAGLRRTIRWFVAHYDQQPEGLRLLETPSTSVTVGLPITSHGPSH